MFVLAGACFVVFCCSFFCVCSLLLFTSTHITCVSPFVYVFLPFSPLAFPIFSPGFVPASLFINHTETCAFSRSLLFSLLLSIITRTLRYSLVSLSFHLFVPVYLSPFFYYAWFARFSASVCCWSCLLLLLLLLLSLLLALVLRLR